MKRIGGQQALSGEFFPGTGNSDTYLIIVEDATAGSITATTGTLAK
jgi:hypothetical protein